MGRINIHARGEDAMLREHESESTLIGWFDPEKVKESISEDTYWDGNNHRGVISELQCGHEALYLTAGGRWVRYYDAHREYNGPQYYEFITDNQAREWLIKNNTTESEALLIKHFGELEEEAGPAVGGRPEVGPKVETRLPADVLERVDARAKAEGVPRAEMLRRLVVAAL